MLFSKNSDKKITFIDQLVLIILVYLLISILIALPFYLSNYQVTFLNSIFESISGLTGTGFSIFENIRYLDPTLVLWRSSSQWIGGLYFFLFLILIFSNKKFNFKMTELTFSGDGSLNSSNNIKNLVLKIFIAYSLTSLVIFVMLNLSDVRLFNSLNLTMTLVSTGGFIPSDSLNRIISSNVQKLFLFSHYLLQC